MRSQRDRTLPSKFIATLAILCTVFFGSSCAAPGTDGSAPEDSSTGEHEGPGEVEREDLIDEQPIAWDNAEEVSDTSIRVFFGAGNEHCYGVRSIVQETDTTVEIAVFEGNLPDAPDVCTMELRNTSLLIETEEPVGDRDIVELTNPALK